MQTTESQNAKILKHLEKGKTINPILALNKFGCFRLGARIYDLKRKGNSIEMEMVEHNGKRFASYKLIS